MPKPLIITKIQFIGTGQAEIGKLSGMAKYFQYRDGSLLAGMATQVYFGSCDAHTAQYVSSSLGKATEAIRPPGMRADGAAHVPQPRQRDLMTPDEVITPPRGNCTIIYRYATATYAAQIVLLAHLTRMYERKDWAARIRQAEASGRAPMLLERPLFERTEIARPKEEARSLPKHIDDTF
jgi:type IV secretory pathway TraG/TraD family ATPase VirD4